MSLFPEYDIQEKPIITPPARKSRVQVVSIKMVREGSLPYNTQVIKSPEDAIELLNDFIGDTDREYFVEICVNTKNKPIAIHTVSIGTLYSATVHPREVFKAAVLSNAAAIILGHNHPSGDPSPSREDIDITKRLSDAGEILGITIMDHIIIGNGKGYSLKEKGLM